MSQGNQGGQICRGKGYGPMPSQGVAIADCKVCREVTDIPGGHRVRAEVVRSEGRLWKAHRPQKGHRKGGEKRGSLGKPRELRKGPKQSPGAPGGPGEVRGGSGRGAEALGRPQGAW
jgi:hypothetical protein